MYGRQETGHIENENPPLPLSLPSPLPLPPLSTVAARLDHLPLLLVLPLQFMKKLMAEVPEPVAETKEDLMLARTKVVEELETVTEG